MSGIHTYDEGALSFQELDQHVSQIHNDHMGSTSDLLTYLSITIPDDDPNRFLLRARSFIAWICTMQQRRDKRTLPEDVRSLCENLPSFTFQTLCQHSDIPCELVMGKGKGLDYQPGITTFDMMPTITWNAFQCGTRWHLVSPDLATSAVKGHRIGGEMVIVRDKQLVLKQSEANTGYVTNKVYDFWFCTKPSIFANFFYPEDRKWQLVDQASLMSSSQFETKSHLLPGFFIHRLDLLSDSQCELMSDNGTCTVTIGNKDRTRLSYELSLVEGTGDLSTIDTAHTDLTRVVMQASGDGYQSFTIRLPCTGEFIFRVFGKPSDLKCCVFRITCVEPYPLNAQLPIDAGETGFGFGHKAKEYGVSHPSQPTPVISMSRSDGQVPSRESGRQGQQTTGSVNFKVDQDMVDEVEFSSDLLVNETQGHAETRFDKDKGDLLVNITLEGSGEYALKINVRERNTDGTFKPIMNYLVTTHAEKADDQVKQISEFKKKAERIKKIQYKEEEKTKLEDQIHQKKAEIERIKQTLKQNSERSQSEKLGSREKLSARSDPRKRKTSAKKLS